MTQLINLQNKLTHLVPFNLLIGHHFISARIKTNNQIGCLNLNLNQKSNIKLFLILPSKTSQIMIKFIKQMIINSDLLKSNN